MDSNFFTLSGQSFTAQEAQIAKLEGQVSSGKKVQNAADDPAAYVGAAQDASQVQGLGAMNASQVNVQETLGSATSALSQVGTALDRIQSIALQAMSGTASSDDFAALGEQVGQGLEQIVSLANTQGSDGNYVFAGTAKHTQPFVQDATGAVSYLGNDGTTSVEIAPGITVNSALSGSVFTNAPAGNGVASISAASGNSGSATVLATGISDAGAASAFHDGSQPVTLGFAASASGALVYTATEGGSTIASGPVDTANGATPTLTLDGVEVTVSGNPAPGDSFTMAPARPQSIFSLVKQVQTALAAPGTTPAARAQTRQILGNALGSIVQYQHRISSTSAKAGVVIAATQTAATANATASTNAQNNASDLVSADLPQVLTQLSDRTTALEAAMKAFSTASQLNLFHYL